MIERRWNYINDLVYDVFNVELQTPEEYIQFLKIYVGDLAINWEWDVIEDVITQAVNYAKECYDHRDELLDSEDDIIE